MSNERIKEVVHNTWVTSSKNAVEHLVREKIEHCGQVLQEWNSMVFGNVNV